MAALGPGRVKTEKSGLTQEPSPFIREPRFHSALSPARWPFYDLIIITSTPAPRILQSDLLVDKARNAARGSTFGRRPLALPKCDTSTSVILENEL